MTITFNDASRLAGRLSADATDREALLISLDGLPGSGKTTLGRRLASPLQGVHIVLDDCLVRNQGTYVDHLRLDDLRDAIASARRQAKIAILDGICMEKVCEGLGVVPDRRVYLRRLDSRGDWMEGEIFVSGAGVNQALQHEEALANMMGSTLPELQREVIEYHFAYAPHENADYVFERRDAPEA